MTVRTVCDFCGAYAANGTTLLLHVAGESNTTKGGMIGDYCNEKCLVLKAVAIHNRERYQVVKP